MGKKEILKNKLEKIKMLDMGQDRDAYYGISTSEPVKKGEKYYPTIHLDLKKSDFGKDLDVGERRKFIIDGMLKSKSISSDSSGKNSSHLCIEIKKMGME